MTLNIITYTTGRRQNPTTNCHQKSGTGISRKSETGYFRIPDLIVCIEIFSLLTRRREEKQIDQEIDFRNRDTVLPVPAAGNNIHFLCRRTARGKTNTTEFVHFLEIWKRMFDIPFLLPAGTLLSSITGWYGKNNLEQSSRILLKPRG